MVHIALWTAVVVGSIVYALGKKDQPRVFIPGALLTIIGLVGEIVL